MKKENGNLLIVGVDLVGLARSANRAGYRVYALDYFCDLDLKAVSEECLSMRAQVETVDSAGRIKSHFDPLIFLKMARYLSEKTQIDAILLSSGLDDHPNVLSELNDLVEILGNHPNTIRRVRDRESFFGALKSLGIPHPLTVVVESLVEAKRSARDIGFPLILKPLEGFAGFGVRRVNNSDQLKKAYRAMGFLYEEGFVVQEYITGTNASMSLIASRSGAKLLSLNEQLLGLQEVYQCEPFGYCGNVVPIVVEGSTRRECEHIVDEISSHFGLTGSNGVDIVIDEDGTPYVMEINPRFQGSLECVEIALGVNLVEMHVAACIHDSLPENELKPKKFCTRLILYAPQRINAPDLKINNLRDIPPPGDTIEPGEPLCSAISDGPSRTASLNESRKLADRVYGMIF